MADLLRLFWWVCLLVLCYRGTHTGIHAWRSKICPTCEIGFTVLWEDNNFNWQAISKLASSMLIDYCRYKHQLVHEYLISYQQICTAVASHATHTSNCFTLKAAAFLWVFWRLLNFLYLANSNPLIKQKIIFIFLFLQNNLCLTKRPDLSWWS